MTFLQFHWFTVHSESAEWAEIFKSWRFFIFLYWSLKGTALIRQITNNECQRGIATRISQSLSILVSRDPDVIFQVKSWSDTVFWWFCRLELVSTPLKSNPTFCLLILQSFLNFSPIPRIRSAERIRAICGYL